METILIVEDDRTYARTTANWLVRNGMDARYVLSADAAKEFLGNNGVGLVLSDFRLGDCNGVELLEWMRAHGYRMPFLVMTGYGDIPGAVEAVKKGADNYLPKPVQTEEVLGVICGLLGDGRKRTAEDNFYVCKSPPAVRLQEMVRLVAPADSLSVLIRGASGTGKEWVARQIHAFSKRSSAPFVAVDCGALPRELAASELFGHKKGTFTGAVEDRNGVFAAANHGTLFLDEIGNLNLETQVLLLRALQEKRYRPLGGAEEVCTDIRLLAATNEDLELAISGGRFREDLFHRLNEFPLHVPLLKDCREDIIPLAGFFLPHANKELGKGIKGFDRDVREAFMSYPWPGNIRELKNVVNRACVLAQGDRIVLKDISLPVDVPPSDDYRLDMERTELEAIVKALETTGNDRKAAARLLGISRSTLYLKLKKYGLI
ncbi:sigma-54-dependent Fis family transcriptional regulator [Bacteroides thetaiotaomicron]|jgi:two-component system response regulator HydG|uniref:Sigma-54-dependent Fis family transcriptional regulator n=1 Tax=Bacteroides thetaiotaomicron TaxID=818 RepID=A0A7J5JPY4_BACT4|nr:sigma-54 dependent transcriptional regulator [Bacteroides thetaiotaomicron]KAB4419162.1 sigma-54-dependent Fis family transcriptional regulator [Bacteroides thetaiotaomicron]KAB4425059.1 sigma-54-dependent Fis family transcriptional regulator [Bacteroides thetaiotaomicron]KAB4435306.1 sigma-54-dependent Fis family transcriptional regulator [Bacteroides thetaiotaomicron]KAB4440695.1 sigma-54-dependent Fis family transcriptional regulator [Bacteroides thetaiotaomicron]KAB4453491.1 sigma-54-de